MRICLSIASIDSDTGGAASWTAGLASHLHRQGHDVTVVTFAGPHAPVEFNVVVLESEPTTEARIDAVDRAVIAIRPDRHYDTGVAGRCDVFHPHSGSEAYSEDRLLRSYPLRVQADRHYTLAARAQRSQRFETERTQVANCGLVLAMSNAVLDVQRRVLHAIPDRQRRIPAGVDLARFPAGGSGDRFEFRSRWSIPQDDVVYLFAAHNLRLKGADLAIAAFARLCGETKAAHLVIAGAPPDAWLFEHAQRSGVADRIAMLGNVANMSALYGAADAMLHPTRWDSFGLVVLEAMASGLPVITTPHAGASELIIDGVNGYVRALSDGRTLLGPLRSLLDLDHRKRVGAEARRTAEEHTDARAFAAVEQVLLEPPPRAHGDRAELADRLRTAVAVTPVGPRRSARRRSQPLVSVVMPVRNGEAFVAEAVQSVLEQSFSDFDLHVVDDGSTDLTPELLGDLAAGDRRIVIHRQKPLGIVAALNAGVARSRGSYIARMDADDRCTPTRLRRQVDHLNANPEVMVLGTGYAIIDEHGTVQSEVILPTGSFDLARLLRTTNPVAHPTVMMRRVLFDALGGYREGFPLCEDYDLWLRAAEVGMLANLGDALLHYRRHGGQTSAKLRQRFRSEVDVLASHHRARALPLADTTRPPAAGDHQPKPAADQIAYARISMLIQHFWFENRGIDIVRSASLAPSAVALSVRRFSAQRRARTAPLPSSHPSSSG